VHNFDISAALSAFVQQIDDAQNKSTGEVQDCVPWYGHGFEPADPAWGAAFSLLPDWIGQYYHDDQIFDRHYAGITAHLDSLIEMAGGALLHGGPNDPHPGAHNLDGLLAFGPYSDWCPAKGCIECADPRKDPSAYNSALVSSYYLIKQLRVVTSYSRLLGHADDTMRYSAVAANVSAKFVHHFYDTQAKTFREVRNCTQYLSPQTSISLGNDLGLVPTDDEEDVMRNLVSSVDATGYHMDTGIVGAKHLLPALSEMGRTDIALIVALQKTAPSYGYMISQGATTLWEAWTGARYKPDPGGSWNHVMFASISDWYYKYLAGLRIANEIATDSHSRGWQRVCIYPRVWIPAINDSICTNLSAVSASMNTPRGLLAVSWNCNVTAPAPPPPVCPPLPPTMRFISNGDDMCTHTKNKSNCGIFLEDKSHHTKAHVVSCVMCGLQCCVSTETVPTNVIAALRTIGPFSCSMCGAMPHPLPENSTKTLFSLDTTVPTGVTAKVVLPMMGADTPVVAESGRVIWRDGAFVPGVAGVYGGEMDKGSGTITIDVSGGRFAFHVTHAVSTSGRASTITTTSAATSSSGRSSIASTTTTTTSRHNTQTGGCSCTCSSETASGFAVSCVGVGSPRFEILLYAAEESPRPFALMEGTAAPDLAGSGATASASFEGLLLPGTRYWVRAAAHNASQGSDISHGWLAPCTTVAVICTTLPAGASAYTAAPPAAPPPLATANSIRPAEQETVEMYRMTELWGLPKNSSAILSPSAVVDFLPSHDSADIFGAAWLYTLSNGFPAGKNPESGKPSGASGPLAFSPLTGAPIARYTVQVSLMAPSPKFPSGYAKYVSCESTDPPQCFCTSACDRLIGYGEAAEVYRDCHRDTQGRQHGCNCTASDPPQLFGPPYPESATHVGRLPIFDVPPAQTSPYDHLPEGVTRKGWWYSTPIAGRCNGTTPHASSSAEGESDIRQGAQGASCSWSRSKFVTMVWADDLKQAGYDFSPLGCAVWVCLPGEAQAAAAMIAKNAVALGKAFEALPIIAP
jgi:hypothetical protein